MGWINCEDVMPTKGEYVIVCNVYLNLIFIGRRSTKYDGFAFEDTFGSYNHTATHWMPLPKLPIEPLKPCPFCGFVAVNDNNLNDGFRVKCSHCDASTKFWATQCEAAKAWNKRCDNG